MSDRNIYTVGWICALPTESSAAQLFLDENHPNDQHPSPNDSNTYALGQLGDHNVVIATLPYGEYGTSAAAVVAKCMLQSFPNIRIGLMVGIGGGAPSLRNDIRLGDIVVSSPSNGNGGVVQSDFGKKMQGQNLQNTGFLNQPPTILRTAVAALIAKHKTHGHKIEESINTALNRCTENPQDFRRPDEKTDILYQAKIVHVDEACCANDPGHDASRQVHRPPRTTSNPIPAIHYGLIASSNSLMKDAIERDRLSVGKNILCFEMEAAGLMNDFPCLVIRGICDYADTHKNKHWQEYAAMAAAAYTKELLSYVLPNKIEAERKLSELITESLSVVNTKIDTISTGVESLQEASQLEKLEKWLSTCDPSANFHTALDQRHPGSGQWFLRSVQYEEWKQENNSFLWLNGIPGCGKTVLSSTVIEHLGTLHSDKDKPLYFYFTFTDTQKQTLRDALCSLLYQLYRQKQESRSYLDLLYNERCKNGAEVPSTKDLRETFQKMLQIAGSVWIILDALDECEMQHEGPKEGLMSWMKSLRGPQANVHLLVTSRPEYDIKKGIEEWAREQDIIPLQSNLIAGDIGSYIKATVRDSPKLQRWQGREDIRTEIEKVLMSKAGGMFRWVACQFDCLEKCRDPITLKEALNSLPETLDETYARIVKDIPPQIKQHAVRILQFLSFSKRPIALEEAVDAITVQMTKRPRFEEKNRMPVPEEITSYCSGLVVLVKRKIRRSEPGGKTNIRGEEVVEIQLAHFSVKEYLTSKRLDEIVRKDFAETAASASIAEVCLGYVLSLDHTRTPITGSKSFPLLLYSAQHWQDHAASAQTDGRVNDLADEFYASPDTMSICWNATHTERIPRPPPLYLAAQSGLFHSVRKLISDGAELNVKDGPYGTALQAASKSGHMKVVEMLLENSAEVNTKGTDKGGALYLASKFGHEKVVEILLQKGAKVNAKGINDATALYIASMHGHEKVVEILLKRGADVNAKNQGNENALSIATFYDNEKVCKVLRDWGVCSRSTL